MNARRIRLLYVVDELGVGGTQRQLSLVAPAMAARAPDIDVTVACLSEITEPFGPVVERGGVPLVAFERHGGADLGRLWALRRFLRAGRFDVVHAFSHAANAYAFAATRGLGLPFVASLRTDRIPFADFEGARARVLSMILRRADRVVTNSAAGRAALVDGAGVRTERVAVVPNCIEPDTSSAQEPPRRRVGFVGRLAPVKQADRLIDAFASLGEGFDDVELVLVGDGSERGALGERAGSAGVAGRVTFTGAVDDARPLMRSFSCLVLPSSYEGLPNAVLEALAAGVPVVASAVGDIPRVVEDGRTGVLTPDTSAEALARAITRVLGDDDLRRLAREEGPRFIRDNFSAERSVDALAALYRALV